MKPSPELIAAVVAAAVAAMVVDVAVAVVVVTAVVVAVATTIVTNANHGGNSSGHGLPRSVAYFLASGFIFRLNLSVPRTTSIGYSSPAFISPSAAV